MLLYRIRYMMCSKDFSNSFSTFPANGNKYYGILVSYCGKAWDVHLDCVMKVGVAMVT